MGLLLLFVVHFVSLPTLMHAHSRQLRSYHGLKDCVDSIPEDCSTIKMANPRATSGVYTIKLMAGPCREVRGVDASGTCCVEVYCDMDRFGNKFLYYFTGRKKYELLVELDQSDVNCSVYARYSWFKITDANKYNLSLGSYFDGTAGDSLSRHNKMPFSTYNHDNDKHYTNCSQLFRGGWWYYHCHHSNLNGEYFDGCTSSYGTKMTWGSSRGEYYSFKRTEMKLRPAEYSLHNPEQDSRLCSKDYTYSKCPELAACNRTTPTDCSEIKLANPSSPSGIYTIKLMEQSCKKEISGNQWRIGICCVEVYCDMERFGGGWTVFQRRFDGTVDFWRNWKEYEDGFGSLYHDFYLGNRVLYYFTKRKTYELHVELGQSNANQCKLYAHYSSFGLTNKEQYSLSLGSYLNGTAGDSLHYDNGAAFSTYDQDNDITQDENCAAKRKGGWWFKECRSSSNLNGEYIDGCSSPNGTGIVWYTEKRHNTLFKMSEMKLRPAGYILNNRWMDSGLCPPNYQYPECSLESTKHAAAPSVSKQDNRKHSGLLPFIIVALLVIVVLALLVTIWFPWKKLKSEKLPSVSLYFENKASSCNSSQHNLPATVVNDEAVEKELSH